MTSVPPPQHLPIPPIPPIQPYNHRGDVQHHHHNHRGYVQQQHPNNNNNTRNERKSNWANKVQTNNKQRDERVNQMVSTVNDFQKGDAVLKMMEMMNWSAFFNNDLKNEIAEAVQFMDERLDGVIIRRETLNNPNNDEHILSKLVSEDGFDEMNNHQQLPKEMFKPMRQLRAKAKFYQYKYIELNLFILIYIVNMQELINGTLTDLMDDLKVKSQHEVDVIQTFIKIAESLGDMANIKTKKISDLGDLAYKHILKGHLDTTLKLKKLQEDNNKLVDDMINKDPRLVA